MANSQHVQWLVGHSACQQQGRFQKWASDETLATRQKKDEGVRFEALGALRVLGEEQVLVGR